MITTFNKMANLQGSPKRVQSPVPFFQPKISVQPTDNIIQRIPMRDTTPTQLSNFNQPVNQPTSASVARRSIPQGVISRAEFDQYVIHNFGVQGVSTGTQQEQEQSITKHNAPAPSITNWQSWSPGASSADYSLIIKSIEDFAEVFASVPVIRTIKFFKIHYEADPTTGIGVSNSNVGASFGAGELTIYEAFASRREFPVARSNVQGNYPTVGIALSTTGSNPGAPIPYPTRERSLSENIVHELGHGVAEAASAADHQALINFNNTVGWVGGSSPALYDIGQQAVQTAITNNTTPPAQYKIEPTNWNDPQWIEQPLSNYSVAGGPGEDFAESIAAFVYSRDVLSSRSPRRHTFILSGINTWITQMHAMPAITPVGDFPVSETIQHTA